MVGTTKQIDADELKKSFLTLFDKETENTTGLDRALFCLLKDEANNIYLDPKNPEWLHKSFRQVDVTSSGLRDIAIHHLMGTSRLVWKVLEQVYKEAGYKDE
jgi:hypothetical protein